MLNTPSDRHPDAVRETALALRRHGRRAGVPTAQLPKVPPKFRGCPLHVDGFMALNLYQRCATQWTYVGSGMGGITRTGVPHTQVRAMAATMRVPIAERRYVIEECEQFIAHRLALDHAERKAQTQKAAP